MLLSERFDACTFKSLASAAVRYTLQLTLLLKAQTVTMLSFSFNGTLQHYDCTELVQYCIVFAAVGVLHTARTAAGRFAVAVLDQLKRLFKQNRKQRGCLHTCEKLESSAATVLQQGGCCYQAAWTVFSDGCVFHNQCNLSIRFD